MDFNFISNILILRTLMDICSFSCYIHIELYVYNVECNMQIWWQTLQCRNTKVTWKTGNQRCQLVNRNTALMLCLQFEEYVFEFPVSIHVNRSHYGGRELMTELSVGCGVNFKLFIKMNCWRKGIANMHTIFLEFICWKWHHRCFVDVS